MSSLYTCPFSFCQIFQTSHSTKAKLSQIAGTMEGVWLMPQNEDLNMGKKFYQRFCLMLCPKCLRFTLARLLFAKSSKPLIAPGQNFLRLLVLWRVFDWCHKIRIWTRAKSFIKDFVFAVNVSALRFLVFLPRGLEFQNFVASPALYCFFLHFLSIYYAKKKLKFFRRFFFQKFSKSQNGET